ncbi:LacI family DNA-binding transcriptional regulator [Quadrisphaera sp. DSM 44207]|uniref:LacI family DNA-binding transcriptional regulator n=1 Tax=Quadrisphaera sp. DSM 44207 TaxID=1881057 RepID=UPI000B80B193
MADVAARAGVSHQTVSRVINGHPSVRPATRDRVERAIADLGYRPNTAARALVTRQSHAIGVVSAATAHYGPTSTLLGLEEAARAAGYVVSVTVLADVGAAAMRAAVEHLMVQSVDALVVIAPQDAAVDAARAVEAAVPLVTVEVSAAGGVHGVSVDQETGARLAVRHLLALGHATVHHVTGPLDWLEARARASGWRAALAEAGAAVPQPLGGDWSPLSGYRAGQRLAAAAEPVTAVFAGNDQMAVGLVRALAEAGLDVPRDVSVVGFDDVPEAAFFAPPLTTVRQDFAELGRRCLQAVLARLAGAAPAARPVAPTLVVRDSTAPPRRAPGAR